MGDRTVAAGRGTLCDPDQPDASIEFHDDPSQSYENLTSTVRSFADGDISRLTLMLKAHDESDPNGWKRFDDDANLSVTYVGVPDVPTSAGIIHGSGTACRPDTAPDIISYPTPTLSARVQTAPGGESGAHLRAHFYVQKKVGTSWELATEPVRPSQGAGTVGDNGLVQTLSPISLANGATYRMAVFTQSLYGSNDTSNLESHSTVTTQDWCYFKIDTTAPQGVNIAFGAPYTPCTANACVPAGGPGTKAQFTFTPLAEDKGTVTGYEYRLSSEHGWSKTTAGETVKQWIIPRLAGVQQLHVRAIDANGPGTENIVEFKVDEGQDAVGRWHFDDGAGDSTATTAADTGTVGTRHLATLNNAGAGWSALARRGAGDRSLWLNDTTDSARQTGYAATSESVVNTHSSFTVSAWTYLTDASVSRTVVSEIGNDATRSGFSLYYSSGVQRWVFLWSWYEGGTRKYQSINADTAGVPLKTWTHVAGSYDADSQTIRLYVNGKLQSATSVLPEAAVAGSSDGALQFGRVNYTNNVYQDYWHGRLDEVTVWQWQLPDDEITMETRLLEADGTSDVELVADWNPVGASGNTLTDTLTGYGHNLALTSGASLDGEAIVLDGNTGAAKTAGPLVDETGSFTVMVGVKLDTAAMADKPKGYTAQIAGQRVADGGASWGLWFEKTGTVNDPETDAPAPEGKWRFGRRNADHTWSAVVSSEAAVVSPNSVAQLTGVFEVLDSSTSAISLHLGEARNGEDLTYTAIAGSGEFALGEPFAGEDYHLPGGITRARIWVGAMSNQQIQEFTGGTDA